MKSALKIKFASNSFSQLSGDLSAVRSEREELLRVLEEAKQQKAEMATAFETAEHRYNEIVSASTTAPLTLVEALVASVKQSILPEVEKVGEALMEDVERKVTQLNANVVGTVWEKVEQPLEALKRLAQGNMKPRGRVPSNGTPRVLPIPYLVPSAAGSQPSTSNVTQ